MAITISKKDKSLLLFIATLFVVLWFAFSFFANIIFTSSFEKSDANKIITAYKGEENRWLNISRELTKEDVEDRVILLDFWTHACVNCVHAIPEIKNLEKRFGDKLLVIGVHSGKFENERKLSSIRKAVLKFDISHPVVNDSDLKIWSEFDVKAWPSFILIDPRGKVEETYVGEGSFDKITEDVKKLVKKYRFHLNRKPLPIYLEKNKIIKTVLSYPTKITYSKNFSYKSYSGPAFFIANSGRNNILVVDKDGGVILQIGSKKAGFQDGVLDVAKFNKPSGLLYKDGVLYVADTANHALRKVVFKKGLVRTIAGNGVRGSVIDKNNVEARLVSLASPNDIEIFKDNVAIANSGTHQILSFDLKSEKISVLAGNGNEGILDGKYPNNTLAQTSDLSAYGGKLYFIDAETSSLRVLDKDGEVKTLIGSGLFDFGHRNGGKDEALMQHPLGLFVNHNGAYISDSFNHKIRKYEFHRKKIKDLFGDKRGQNLGDNMQFDEPDDITIIGDNMYVVDSNNNRIVRINFDKMRGYLFNVMPSLQLPKEGFLEYLPNLNRAKNAKIKPEGGKIEISFDKGWKINEKGPSFLNLLEMVDKKKANLVKTFDWNMVKNNEMNLPKLQEGKRYVIQGTIYYCEDKANALCLISSYEQNLDIDISGDEIIKIEL